MNRARQQQAQPRRVDPADPIRCVSVISAGSVAIRPEHVRAGVEVDVPRRLCRAGGFRRYGR